MPPPSLAVTARSLGKRYGDRWVLRDLDLDVPTGTICGLLGPNGAGKTTTVRILTTLLTPDEGTAEVAGFDVVRDPTRVRPRIGLAGQQASVDELLTGRSNLDLVGRLNHLGRTRTRARVDELLERFSLTDAADRLAKTYSGGMRRRLDLAASLMASPPVLFLDEPTTGLDPRSRNDLWDVLRNLVADGITVVLTTQYLEEADRLADDILVIDHGTVVAHGSPDQLKEAIGGSTVEVVLLTRTDMAAAAGALEAATGHAPHLDPDEPRLSVSFDRSEGAVARAVRALDDVGIETDDVGLRRASLDDVFLTLTGHLAEQPDAPDGPRPTDVDLEEALS